MSTATKKLTPLALKILNYLNADLEDENRYLLTSHSTGSLRVVGEGRPFAGGLPRPTEESLRPYIVRGMTSAGGRYVKSVKGSALSRRYIADRERNLAAARETEKSREQLIEAAYVGYPPFVRDLIESLSRLSSVDHNSASTVVEVLRKHKVI